MAMSITLYFLFFPPHNILIFIISEFYLFFKKTAENPKILSHPIHTLFTVTTDWNCSKRDFSRVAISSLISSRTLDKLMRSSLKGQGLDKITIKTFLLRKFYLGGQKHT